MKGISGGDYPQVCSFFPPHVAFFNYIFLFFSFTMKIPWRIPSRRTSKHLTSARRRCSQHTPSGLAWPSTSRSSTMKSSTTRTRLAAWLRRYGLKPNVIIYKSFTGLLWIRLEGNIILQCCWIFFKHLNNKCNICFSGIWWRHCWTWHFERGFLQRQHPDHATTKG